MSQQFCLKWNNHTTNMLQVFESLLSTEALVDVTLACDGLSLKAHKMVLSACSPFFQSLFLENPCKHPIVIMKDMRYCDLKAIIDFMYRGEVNVSHDQLSALLKTAETLKVKGLAEVTGDKSGIVQQEISQQQTNSVAPSPVPSVVPTPTTNNNSISTPATPTAQRTDTPPLAGKRKRGRPRKRSLSDSNRSDDEGLPNKIKDRDSPDIEELSGDASMEATSDIRSGGGTNSHSQAHSSSNAVNNFSKSHLSISQDDDQASGDEFEVEPSKLLEQTLTTDNVPSNSHNSTGHANLPSVSGLEISRRSMSSTDSISQALVPASDSLSSNLQGPDSPQDIKPNILSFDDPPISPVAGPSHSSERSMMMYMDQAGVSSIAGPSNYQDNSALVPHDSQPQGTCTALDISSPQVTGLNLSVLDQIKHPDQHKVEMLFCEPKKSFVTSFRKNKKAFPTNFPKGWRREIKQRKYGKTKGVIDTYIYSPRGKKFRSSIELEEYLKKVKSNLTIKDFSLCYGRRRFKKEYKTEHAAINKKHPFKLSNFNIKEHELKELKVVLSPLKNIKPENIFETEAEQSTGDNSSDNSLPSKATNSRKSIFFPSLQNVSETEDNNQSIADNSSDDSLTSKSARKQKSGCFSSVQTASETEDKQSIDNSSWNNSSSSKPTRPRRSVCFQTKFYGDYGDFYYM